MKDFLGNELQIGDEIVFIDKMNGGAELKLGKIYNFTNGSAHIQRKLSDRTYEDIMWGVYKKGKSIMKIGAQIV